MKKIIKIVGATVPVVLILGAAGLLFLLLCGYGPVVPDNPDLRYIGKIQYRLSGCMFSVLLANGDSIDLQVSECEWEVYQPGMTYPTKEVDDLCKDRADTPK